MKNALKLRLITAAILVPIVVFGILFAKPFWFDSALLGLYFLANLEWLKLLKIYNPRYRLGVSILLTGLLAVIYNTPMLYTAMTGINFAYVMGGFWILAFIFLFLPRGAKIIFSSQFIHCILGLIWLGGAFLAFRFIWRLPEGAYLTLILLVLIWSADTGGYFVGKRFGKHRLAPKVSPGKTWEGTAGAVILSGLVLFCINLYMQTRTGVSIQKFGVNPWMLWALVSVGSVVGDLWESLLKRLVNCKDSGGLLPGHGGILDRLDSAFCVFPVFIVLMMLFN